MSEETTAPEGQETAAPALTETELARIALLHEFQTVVAPKVKAVFQAVEAEFKALTEAKTAEIATQNDDEIDSAVAALLVKPAMTTEEAEEQLSQFPPGLLPMIVMQMGVDPDALLGEDVNYHAVAVDALLKQNPGVTEEQAQTIAYDDMSRNQKRGMLAQKFAAEAMGGDLETVANEKGRALQEAFFTDKGTTLEEVNAGLQAIAETHGPEVIQAELAKLAGPAQP